ncbi:MAG: hypothetical protein KDK72_02705 [Chlamydiia bacterium]|nr:hypothetical protein [Chlamydiia bacterium]
MMTLSYFLGSAIDYSALQQSMEALSFSQDNAPDRDLYVIADRCRWVVSSAKCTSQINSSIKSFFQDLVYHSAPALQLLLHAPRLPKQISPFPSCDDPIVQQVITVIKTALPAPDLLRIKVGKLQALDFCYLFSVTENKEILTQRICAVVEEAVSDLRISAEEASLSPTLISQSRHITVYPSTSLKRLQKHLEKSGIHLGCFPAYWPCRSLILKLPPVILDMLERSHRKKYERHLSENLRNKRFVTPLSDIDIRWELIWRQHFEALQSHSYACGYIVHRDPFLTFKERYIQKLMVHCAFVCGCVDLLSHAFFQSNRSHVVDLNLRGIETIDDDFVNWLISLFPRLRHLNLCHCSHVSDKYLSNLIRNAPTIFYQSDSSYTYVPIIHGVEESMQNSGPYINLSAYPLNNNLSDIRRWFLKNKPLALSREHLDAISNDLDTGKKIEMNIHLLCYFCQLGEPQFMLTRTIEILFRNVRLPEYAQQLNEIVPRYYPNFRTVERHFIQRATIYWLSKIESLTDDALIELQFCLNFVRKISWNSEYEKKLQVQLKRIEKLKNTHYNKDLLKLEFQQCYQL